MFYNEKKEQLLMLEEKKVSELNDDELQRVAGGYCLTANFDSGDWFLND